MFMSTKRSFSVCTRLQKKSLRVPPLGTTPKKLPPRLKEDVYKMTPFKSMLESRRDEAKRSLCVQVRSKYSAEDLFMYCTSAYGNVKGLHFYQNKTNATFSHFYIVEFENRSAVEIALEANSVGHQPEHYSTCIPVVSPFVWLAGKNQNSPQQPVIQKESIPIYVPAYFSENKRLSDQDLLAHLRNFTSLEMQMKEYQAHTEMSDVSKRVRFLACEQIELVLSGMFGRDHGARIWPFGSSVNSFGSCNSDLDMVLEFEQTRQEEKTRDDCRFFFHVKGGYGEREMSQMYISVFARIIQNLLPGCQNVLSITNARVPIVKYQQQLLGLECDLSASSMSGCYMSELLYLYGELDPRVRPMVLTVRRWAKESGFVTDRRPTKLFTNFPLTLMTIFFLQYKHKILPSLNNLRDLAEPSDVTICRSGVKRDFASDISGYQPILNAHYGNPNPNLETLICDFFDFYSTFDFHRYALDLITGTIHETRSGDPLHIINPLEPALNVSANVNSDTVKTFQLCCKRTLSQMNVNPSFDALCLNSKIKMNINLGEIYNSTPREASSTASVRKNIMKSKDKTFKNQF